MRHSAPATIGLLLAWALAATPAVAGAEPPSGAHDAGPRPEGLPALAPVDGGRPHWRKNLFLRVFSDQKYLFTTWIPSEARRPAVTLSFAATLVVATQSDADRRVAGPASDWSLHHASREAQYFSDLGTIEVAAAALGGTYLVSRWTGHARGARVASLSAEALINAGLYSSLLKRITQRTRPAAGGTGAFFVDEPAPDQEPTSFPSGHATGAFAVATVLATEFRDKRWVPWLAYGTAGLVGLSRIALGRHFPTDVVFGALLGNSVGRMVTSREASYEGRHRRRSAQWSIEPLVDPVSGGLGAAWHRSW